jgi:hypothetical protein
MNDVTEKQRKAGKANACCYALPDTCVPPFVGRLLRVEGEMMTASREQRADWGADTGLDAHANLDLDLRFVLAAHYRGMALAEHASIASFSRASLQLMALGAPPDILAATHAAALDEVEHARIAFAIASQWSDAPEGPGALPVEALAVQPLPLDELLVATFLDACVGETIGAVVARASAARVTDPSLRGLLERIASDEERHAELAWKTVAWAVRAGGFATRRALAEAVFRLDEGLAPLDRAWSAPEHGVLARDEEEDLRRRAIAEIVLPCARALAEA